jgi:hypothetical protein
MDVTVSGMIMPMSEVLNPNALSPMATTSYPPNMEGIVMFPLVPEYPVTVAVPLHTV